MLRDNYSEYSRNKTRGVPRDGKALLHGITYCGDCGHKMCVQYKGGTQYLCNHLKQQTGAKVCQRIGGDAIDNQVVAWFFEALSVAEIDVTAQALQTTDTEHASVLAARRQQVDRLRYQTQLAERQFMKSDPDNRLVTGELERRWETHLRELKAAEEQYEKDQRHTPQYAIPADLLAMLKDVGAKLPEVWNSELLKTSQKKALLRSLIDKVVIHRIADDSVQLRVVWRGGATTSAAIAVTVGALSRLSFASKMEATIEQMAQDGKSDEVIAQHLTAQGYRSPRSDVVLISTVRLVRIRKRILRRPDQSHPRLVPKHLTISQLAEKLGVSRSWIHDRIHAGTIKAVIDPRANCYLFPDSPETLAELNAILSAFRHKMACRRGHQDE